MKRTVSHGQLYPLLVALLAFAAWLSVTRGAMTLPAGQSLLAIWDGVWGSSLTDLKSFQQAVVWELRMPRTLLAMSIGALLSVCGAITQGLFRNPLADPGIIGVSTGAGLGAALSIVLIPMSVAALTTPIAAFLGGLLTTLLVYRLAHSSQGTSVVILLLAGVAIAAFAGAAIGFLTYIADDQTLRDLSLWGMGTLNAASYPLVGLALATLIVTLSAAQRDAGQLNALLIGEPEARHTGIDVERLKLRMIVVAAIGVGVSVSITGVIGFLGLVVPHLVRMLVGPDHRVLLPLSALMGAGLLMLADVGARTLMAPAELPVGLMTALIGAPFFTVLLIRQRKHLL